MKKWIILGAIAAIISVSIGILLGIQLRQILVAAGLTAVLVLSGFFFKSRGDRENLKGNE